MGSGEPSQNLKEDVEQSRQAEQLKLEPPNENSAVIPIVVTENQTTAIPVTNVLEASDNSRLSGNFPQQSVAPQGRRLSRFLPSASTQPEVEEHHPPKPEVAEHTEKEEVLDLELEALIQTAPSVGLTDSEASLRLEKFGPNGNAWLI